MTFQKFEKPDLVIVHATGQTLTPDHIRQEMLRRIENAVSEGELSKLGYGRTILRIRECVERAKKT